MNLRETFSSTRRKSRLCVTGALLLSAALALAGTLTPGTVSRSQAAGVVAAINPDALDAMLAQLKKQQEQMVTNQTKIETQLAALKEEIRLTKIYAGRSGGANRR